MKKILCLVVPLVILGIEASKASVLFYDNFNDGPTGNIVTPLNWDVFNGTVDIGDPKDAWWGTSEYATLDLEGSLPSEAGAIIKTKQEFTLAPGTYELSFKAAGSSYENFSPIDTFSYGLTDIFTGTETYEWDRTAQFVYYKFNVTKSKQTRIFFDQDDATDYYGIHIDEIKLVREASVRQASVLFYDNFNDGPQGIDVEPQYWDVFNGTVDIGDPKDAWWGSQEHSALDLEGFVDSGAIIKTKQEFTLTPGTYELSFKAAGSSYENFSPSDTFSYGLTDIFTGTETYEWDRTAQFVYYKFNVTKSKQTRIFFDQDDATDAYGIHIDEIKLVRLIPEPCTFVLSVISFVGIGGYRRPKRRSDMAR